MVDILRYWILFVLMQFSSGRLVEIKEQDSKIRLSLKFLLENKIFTDINEPRVIGVVVFSSVSPDTKDSASSWLRNMPIRELPGVIVIDKDISLNITITDAVIFLDTVDEQIETLLNPFLARSRVLQRDIKYIFVVTRFTADSTYDAKLLWTKTKLINYIVMFIENDAIISYHPFKETVKTFEKGNRYTSAGLYGNKLNNFYQHDLRIAYRLKEPYVYRNIANRLVGLDLSFIISIAKSVNATAKLLCYPSYTESTASILQEEADISITGVYLMNTSFWSIGYPHTFIDVVLLVKAPEAVPALENLFSIFDTCTWLLIIAVILTITGLRMVGLRVSMTSVRILTLLLGIFSIIFGQIAQTWITTFLIYPKLTKQIDTIDEVCKEILELYSYKVYEPILTRKLEDRIRYVEKFEMVPELIATNPESYLTGYVSPKDYRSGYFNRVNNVYENYHEVSESVGTTLTAFPLSDNSPFKELLKNGVLRSLAYGYLSKEWGGRTYVSDGHKNATKKLALSHFKGVFSIWALGLALSALVFAGELFY